MVINENTPKKICILSNGLVRGGTDTFVVNLAKGLDKTKYDITVVLPVTGNENCLRVPELLEIGVTVKKTCSLTGFRGRAVHLFRLFRILREEKFDVFQTNIDLFNGVNIFVSWLAGTKIRICHSHNAQQQKEVDCGRTLSVRLYQGAMRWLCWTFSNRRTGCSKKAMDFLFGEKWERDPKSCVIYNGIDLSDFHPTEAKQSKKRSYGLEAPKHIVTVGRLECQKNPLFLEEIFWELCKLRDDCDLLWIGTGTMEEELRDKIKEHGLEHRIHLMGSRDDVNELLGCADVFLLPSIYEGLPFVLIEAQASGLPCVASDVISGEVDCGGVKLVSLDLPSPEWAKEISRILDGNHNLRTEDALIRKYTVENMVYQMECVFA